MEDTNQTGGGAGAPQSTEDYNQIAPEGTALVAKIQASPGYQSGQQENIQLFPVYSEDPNSPNWGWSQATPSGGLQLNVSNPGAFGRVSAGKEYYVFLVPVDAEERARIAAGKLPVKQ